MELSKIQDGFLVDDVLEIIAQVQVIRYLVLSLKRAAGARSSHLCRV
jgi:hypothetical protein